jgi:hypothetical protein
VKKKRRLRQMPVSRMRASRLVDNDFAHRSKATF